MTDPASDANQSMMLPPSLPSDAREFHAAAGEIALPHASDELPPAMETLGPAPFPKGKFPFLGFLASVYEHVATHARARATRSGPIE